MAMNFFSWIREGVRQAVLLGVNDAVEHIGTPPDGNDMGQRLLDVVRRYPAPRPFSPRSLPNAKSGRRLEEIHASVTKSE